MKTTISKSAVMKRAWNIFRGRNADYNYSFSASLRRAWWVEKESIAAQQRKAEELAVWSTPSKPVVKNNTEISDAYAAGLIEYYNDNRGFGFGGRRYYGD